MMDDEDQSYEDANQGASNKRQKRALEDTPQKEQSKGRESEVEHNMASGGGEEYGRVN